ncbi:hypothetical protein [Vulcanococcus limneticus]|jgi:hypothetical protein|uniref:hypothetical protein n=1 Tax=Vulcanococcus limneticus TaxID=2170428 RepID=UPI00398C2424
MAARKIRWYVKAQAGVLLLPAGLCLIGEAITRRTIHTWAQSAQSSALIKEPGPWFWYGTFGLIAVVAGVGLMIESGLLRGYPGQKKQLPE